MPDRETVVLDLLVAAGRDPQKAVDVFARKFGVAEARFDTFMGAATRLRR